MKERIQRVLALRMDPDELAHLLGVTTSDLLKWGSGKLRIEQTDILEVGVALLEMRISHVTPHDLPTTPLSAIPAV